MYSLRNRCKGKYPEGLAPVPPPWLYSSAVSPEKNAQEIGKRRSRVTFGGTEQFLQVENQLLYSSAYSFSLRSLQCTVGSVKWQKAVFCLIYPAKDEIIGCLQNMRSSNVIAIFIPFRTFLFLFFRNDSRFHVSVAANSTPPIQPIIHQLSPISPIIRTVNMPSIRSVVNRNTMQMQPRRYTVNYSNTQYM